MDKLVTELEQQTQQALAELITMDVERLSEYMERRGTIMQALLKVTEVTAKSEMGRYKARIQAVLSLDPIFVKKLRQFRDEASVQLAKIDNGKTQRNAYDNNYDVESYFFDRKK
ncbi:hypothetical protein GC096_21990 [Paenibacillus sp. LMG 31461]|uniref:Flagellar protein FliT n=1 Tax=Paenibacillus plantarum TaxID=2654975 RepID=A0ABX1XFC8_9BACL|nr:hypothetical protein [Paenibacillus plantarum]NOU66721.1 hypothetical protein [Paenibacillus plantarum]